MEDRSPIHSRPALRPAEFRALFEGVPGPYVALLPDPPCFTVVAVSDAYARATSTRREEILGRGLFEVLPAASANGAPELRASLERVIEHRAPSAVPVHKHHVRAEDGHVHERLWSGFHNPVFDQDGRLAYILHCLEDVTDAARLERAGSTQHPLAAETREREAHMAAVIDAAVDAIITIDERGTIQSFNPAAERMFGVPASAAIGRNVNFLMPSPDSELHDGRLAAYLTTGVKRIIGVGREVRCRRSDGGEFPAHLSVSEVRLAGRRLFTGFLRDLTERKRLEAEYLQAQKMEAVGRLAGGVAHDFNNLLSGIQAGLRIAMKGLDQGHPALALLSQVDDEVVRGAAITRRLLDFSRTELPATRAIDPCEVVRGTEPLIRRLLGEDIAVRSRCRTAGSFVMADPRILEQALLNLAINARDAMPRGGTLDVACEDAELGADAFPEGGDPARPGAYVVLTVEDTGCGMDETTLSRAREAFFTTKGPGKGTGLGLSTVDSMVRGWHGYLELASTPGVGTRVRVFLPRAERAQPAGADPPLVQATGPCGGGETILVVEDEKLVRLGIQHLLEEQGYTVRTAKDPDEALAELHAHGSELDLLLSDVLLPGMSGPELVLVARAIDPRLPSLFMSAFPQEELVAQGRIEPGALVIEKPFRLEDVVAKVRAALCSSLPRASD